MKIEPMDALLEGLEKLGQDRILADLEALNAAYVRLFITIPAQLKGEDDGTMHNQNK